jgi:hypothetical protein
MRDKQGEKNALSLITVVTIVQWGTKYQGLWGVRLGSIRLGMVMLGWVRLGKVRLRLVRLD